MEPSDEELVTAVLRGDRESFSELVRRHQDAVYSVCCHFLGQADEAQDAAQEALIRAYSSLPHLRNPRVFGSWLRGIAAHVALDLARQRQRLLACPDVDASGIRATSTPDTDPEQAVAARETSQEVRRAIGSLPETYRVVATLRFGLNMKYAEIAEAPGISEGAVEVRLVRARRILRQKLSPLLAAATEGVA